MFKFTTSGWATYGYQNWGTVKFAHAKRYALTLPGTEGVNATGKYTVIPENAIIPVLMNKDGYCVGCMPAKNVRSTYTLNNDNWIHIFYYEGSLVAWCVATTTLYYYLPN